MASQLICFSQGNGEVPSSILEDEAAALEAEASAAAAAVLTEGSTGLEAAVTAAAAPGEEAKELNVAAAPADAPVASRNPAEFWRAVVARALLTRHVLAATSERASKDIFEQRDIASPGRLHPQLWSSVLKNSYGTLKN